MPKKAYALSTIAKRYFEKDPVSAAQCFELMSEEEAVSVLKDLPLQILSKVFRYLQPNCASSFLKSLNHDELKSILSNIEPVQGAAIFKNLSEDTRESFLQNLPEKLKREIYDYLNYPEDSVGRVMSTNYLALSPTQKVKDVISIIKTLAKKQSSPSYMYVVDSESRLLGVVNSRDLILSDSNASIESIMRKGAFTINAFTDTETAANDLSRYKYFAAPVVDNENRLIGLIPADKLISEAQEEAAKDLQTMFGVGGDEKVFSPILFSLKSRLPWLHVNLLTAFLAAAVVALFEDTIAKITVLAIFLPVVAGQGGNAGAQSLAIVMRGIVMREIPKHKHRILIFKEAFLGIINGTVTGIVTGLIAWMWYGNPFLGVVIGLAMIINLFAAGLSGSSIPIIMKKVGLDPAQCSSIILTTVTDVVGFFAFLGIAVLFQEHLV